MSAASTTTEKARPHAIGNASASWSTDSAKAARLAISMICVSLASLAGVAVALWMRYPPVTLTTDMARNQTYMLRLPQLYKSDLVNSILLSRRIPLNALIFFPVFVFLVFRVHRAVMVLCIVVIMYSGVAVIWLTTEVVPDLKLILAQASFILPTILQRILLPRGSRVWIVSLLLWFIFMFASGTVFIVSLIPSDDVGVRLVVSAILLPLGRELISIPTRALVRDIVETDWLHHEKIRVRRVFAIVFPLAVLQLSSGLARLLAASIADWRLNAVTIFTMTCMEIILRLTVVKRDQVLMQMLGKSFSCAQALAAGSFKIAPLQYRSNELLTSLPLQPKRIGKLQQKKECEQAVTSLAIEGRAKRLSVIVREKEMNSREATSIILICEMLGEHMSILCATIVLILFRDVPLLFPFQAYTDSKDPFGGEFNWTRQLLIAFGMLVGEFLADSICILYDMRMHKLPIVDTWKKYSLKVLVICVGLSSMIGIPGMIVGSLMATGTSAECSSMNLCYCIRTSSMRPGSLGERYCERLYPITAGEPYGIQAVFVMGFETGLEWTSTRLEFELIRPVRSSASLATVVSTQHYDAYPAREDALSLSRAVLDKDFAFRDMPGMVIFVIVGASDQEPAILARNGSLCDDVPPMLALRAPTPALFAAAVDEIVDGRNVSSLAFSKMCP